MRVARAWRKVLLASLAAALLFSGFVYWDNQRIVVREVTVGHADLPAGFEGYRILPITDLEGRRFGNRQQILADAIGRQDFDMVLLTGDYAHADSKVDGATAAYRAEFELRARALLMRDRETAFHILVSHRPADFGYHGPERLSFDQLLQQAEDDPILELVDWQINIGGHTHGGSGGYRSSGRWCIPTSAFFHPMRSPMG